MADAGNKWYVLKAVSGKDTTVQKLLGHTSVKTTQIYSEVLSSTIVRDLKNVQRKKVKMFPDKGLRTSDFIDNR